MYSVYIHLRSCAPQRPTSEGTHLLQRVTCRVNCQKWTRCHGSPGLTQADALASASSSHQHENTTFNNSTSPYPGKSLLARWLRSVWDDLASQLVLCAALCRCVSRRSALMCASSASLIAMQNS